MKFWRLRMLGLAAALVAATVVFMPALVAADAIDPTARWLAPWSFTPNSLSIDHGFGADASAFRSFGDLGDAENLPDTAASAFSRASASSGTFGDASASTGLSFSRSFQLSGSPDGWDVKLSGRLVGLLLAASSSSPSASVTASAMITGGPAINFGTITVAPDRQLMLDRDMVGSAVKSDGTYTVQGSLTTSASIQASGLFSSSGSAIADFAAPGNGFFVGVDATPRAVPEPSILILLGTGLVGIGGAARRKLWT